MPSPATSVHADHPPTLALAEEHLDFAASEGTVEVIVPLLKDLNGGDEKAKEQPSRCVAVIRCSDRCVHACHDPAQGLLYILPPMLA
jgi:hypothetical protein